MENDIKKKLVIPFIIFLGFIALSAGTIYKGIVHHELWRVVLASVSGVVFIGFIALIVYTVRKDSKRTA